MIRKITLIDIQKYNKLISEEYKRKSAVIVVNIGLIKDDPDTVKINYPEYKKSFDYVDKTFPNKNVKDVTIYLCSTGLLKKLGYFGLGGFFEKVMKTIVINKDMDFGEGAFIGKISVDEAIVHELLHYVSDLSSTKKTSVEIEEEFAYSNSLGYLRSKKYTDEEIINNNFLPFLSGLVNPDPIIKNVLVKNNEMYDAFLLQSKENQDKKLKEYEDQINEEVKKEARKKGREIIEIFDNKGKKIKMNFSNDETDFSLVEW